MLLGLTFGVVRSTVRHSVGRSLGLMPSAEEVYFGSSICRYSFEDLLNSIRPGVRDHTSSKTYCFEGFHIAK